MNYTREFQPPIQEAGEVTVNEILEEHFGSNDSSDDELQLAITLNPELGRIKRAMKEFAQKMCQAKDREIAKLKESRQYILKTMAEDLLKVAKENKQLKSSQVKEGEVVYRKVSVKDRLPNNLNNKTMITKEQIKSAIEEGNFIDKKGQEGLSALFDMEIASEAVMKLISENNSSTDEKVREVMEWIDSVKVPEYEDGFRNGEYNVNYDELKDKLTAVFGGK